MMTLFRTKSRNLNLFGFLHYPFEQNRGIKVNSLWGDCYLNPFERDLSRQLLERGCEECRKLSCSIINFGAWQNNHVGAAKHINNDSITFKQVMINHDRFAVQCNGLAGIKWPREIAHFGQILLDVIGKDTASVASD